MLSLPDSFEAYLAGRSPGTRKGLKGKLRRVEREGGTARAVSAPERDGALSDFVRLHTLRARAKGEEHPQIDDRLARMLAMLGDDLRAFELLVGGERIAVTLRLDRNGVAHFYNGGSNPAWAHLSPGIVVELASIRDAIGRGLRQYDLGPGDFRYKRDLGGMPAVRCDVGPRAFSASERARRLARIVVSVARRARNTHSRKQPTT